MDWLHVAHAIIVMLWLTISIESTLAVARMASSSSSLVVAAAVPRRQLTRAASWGDDDDIMWSSIKYMHVKERWPDLCEIELQQRAFGTYTVTENIWVPFSVETTDGPLWLLERSPLNKRGDAVSPYVCILFQVAIRAIVCQSLVIDYAGAISVVVCP
jgi:hypothetical protein